MLRVIMLIKKVYTFGNKEGMNFHIYICLMIHVYESFFTAMCEFYLAFFIIEDGNTYYQICFIRFTIMKMIFIY